MTDEIEVRKSTLYITGIVLLILVGGFFMLKVENSNSSGNLVDAGNGEAQKITLSMKNYNYYPNTVKVEVGKPVRIYLDSSVVGCYRSFTIRDFGIAKYLKTPNDYVEFTPTKKGTIPFSCLMGMGQGKIIVT